MIHKRKRAYHRALKRQEPWALSKQATRKMMEEMSKSMFSDSNCKENTVYLEGLTYWINKDNKKQ